jgi:uncharacterized membrane protein SpoIIM required for sporulation
VHLNLARFLATRHASWEELDALIDKAGTKPESLGVDGVARLGGLYRGTAADLALARRRFATDPVTFQLERRVARARGLIYGDQTRRRGVRVFFATDYWRLVAERPRLLVATWALLMVPAFLTALWAWRDPDAATRAFVPGQFRSAIDPSSGREVLPPDQAAAFTTNLFTHNITVTFLALAAGITAGVGTAILIADNGAILGTIGGVLAGSGHADAFIRLVMAHGVIELSCIVVTSYAGMRMGLAMIRPGNETRGAALRKEALSAVGIVLGTTPWLVLAGFIEAVVTPALGVPGQLVVGLSIGALYWALVWWRGRGVHVALAGDDIRFGRQPSTAGRP